MRTIAVIGRSLLLPLALACGACGGGSSPDQPRALAVAASDPPPQAASPLPVLQDSAVEAPAGQTLTLPVDVPQSYRLDLEQAPEHGIAEVNGATIRYTPDPNFEEDRFALGVYNQAGDKVTASVFVTVTFPTGDLPPIADSPNCASGNCVAGEGYFGETCDHWLLRTGQDGLKAVRSTDTAGPWRNLWQHSQKCVYQGPAEVDFKTLTLISAGRCVEGDPNLTVFGSSDTALKPVARCEDYVNSSRVYNTLVF